MSGSGAEADTEGQGTEPQGAAGGDSRVLQSMINQGPELERSPGAQLLEADQRVNNSSTNSMSVRVFLRWADWDLHYTE